MRHSHDSHDNEHHGGRRQRFFGHGELRLVLLHLLRDSASHGYELIKAIEMLTEGNYTPSPGVIYPTLDLLRDQQLITVSDEENGRRVIAITRHGQQWLDESQQADKLFENQQLLRQPIVRSGRQAAVGYCPEVWEKWE